LLFTNGSTCTASYALGIVSVLVLALAVFATQTRIDFTLMHSMLFTLFIGLIILGVLSIFFYSHFIRIVYATLGAVVFSAYLIYDVQLLMGRGCSLHSRVFDWLHGVYWLSSISV
jgi:FtsH-binding integral membrane protein